MTALMLLSPGTPMLFQGQEFWTTTPFVYFADAKPDLSGHIVQGRRKFLAQFPSPSDEEMVERLADPGDPRTFARSTLDGMNASFRSTTTSGVDGVVIGPEALALRFFSENRTDRLLLINRGEDLNLFSIADPLVAPPAKHRWSIEWSSENPRYGGSKHRFCGGEQLHTCLRRSRAGFNCRNPS